MWPSLPFAGLQLRPSPVVIAHAAGIVTRPDPSGALSAVGVSEPPSGRLTSVSGLAIVTAVDVASCVRAYRREAAPE